MKQHQVVDGRWVVHEPHREAGRHWHCRVRDLVSGRTVKFSTRESSLPRARQAARQHVKVLAARENGAVLRRGFAEAFGEFVSSRPVAPSTRERYDWNQRVLAAAFEGRAVDEVDRRAVDAFVCDLHKRNRAPKTIAEYVRLVRSFYRWAVEVGYAARNPTDGVHVKRQRRVQPVALTFEEARRLLAACRAETTKLVTYSNRAAAEQSWAPPGYLWLAVLVALYTGLRRSNVLGLRWRHVDLTRRAIRIEAQGMKAGREHEVPIHPVLAAALKAKLAGQNPVDPGAVVVGEMATDPGRAFQSALRRASLPRMRFHDLRVTFNTWVNQTATYAIAQRLMGHSDAGDVTMGYFAPPFETLRDAVDKLPDLSVGWTAATMVLAPA